MHPCSGPILIKAPHLCGAQLSGRECYSLSLSYSPPPLAQAEWWSSNGSSIRFFIIILSQNFGHQFMFIIFSLYFAFTNFHLFSSVSDPDYVPIFVHKLCVQKKFTNYVHTWYIFIFFITSIYIVYFS